MDTWDLACAITRVVSLKLYGDAEMLDAMDFEDLALDLKYYDEGDQESYTPQEIWDIANETGMIEDYR